MPNVVELHVSGKAFRVNAEAHQSLLSVLREDLDLTGTKYGCGEGQCGACTVLIDGVPARSCITPVNAVVTKEITTIEGLEQNGELHPVQAAFLSENAFQCGYCTSGMILAGVALLKANPKPSDREIVRRFEAHLCRCCGYPQILQAMRRAASSSQG